MKWLLGRLFRRRSCSAHIRVCRQQIQIGTNGGMIVIIADEGRRWLITPLEARKMAVVLCECAQVAAAQASLSAAIGRAQQAKSSYWNGGRG